MISIQETPSSTNILVNGVSLVTSSIGMPSGYYYSFLADASASHINVLAALKSIPAERHNAQPDSERCCVKRTEILLNQPMIVI